MKRQTSTESTTTLKKVERKLKGKRVAVPVYDDPRTELRRLVKVHKSLTKASVALHHMASDRQRPPNLPNDMDTVRSEAASRGSMADTKSIDAVLAGTATAAQKVRAEYLQKNVVCLLPKDDQEDLLSASKRRSASAAKLESAMVKELRKLDVYKLFMVNVFGLGPVVSGYLGAMVDIQKAEKPSQLIRYCGYACIDGKAERRREGFAPRTGITGNAEAKGTFNLELKTRIWQAMAAMWKNGAKSNCTTKYLTRWRQEKDRRLLQGQTKGKAHDAGRRAATDLLLYDLYLVWRAIEGLPSWVTWYDWTRGYEHGRGPLPRENAPRMLTVDEALAIVGNVGKDIVAIAAE